MNLGKKEKTISDIIENWRGGLKTLLRKRQQQKPKHLSTAFTQKKLPPNASS